VTMAAGSGQTIDPAAACSIRVESGDGERVSAWLNETGAAQGIPADPLWRLEMCVTEAFANVVTHGGPGARSNPIGLQMEVHRSAIGGEAVVTVTDRGIAFDPLAVPPKTQARSLAEAEPGGLGLPLMRRFSESLDYRRSEGCNHLTILVRWDEAG